MQDRTNAVRVALAYVGAHNAPAIASFLRALPAAKGQGWQEVWNVADLAQMVEAEYGKR